MSTDDEAVQHPAEADSTLGAGYGEEYSQWKDWSAEAFGVLSRREEADLSAQIRKAKTAFPPHTPVLEIGFGNGTFLTYGARQQWEMHGTEMNAGLVDRARQNGFDVVRTQTLKSFPDRSFNLVAAFDVIEHVPQQNMLEFLGEIKRVLKDGGVLIARFPNGDSPFGRFGQHGDPTHVTTIGSVKATYFAMQSGMEIVYLGGESQPLWAGWPCLAYRVFAVPVKSLMNSFLNFLFFPREPKALTSPNLILIVRVTNSAPPPQ